MGITKIARDTKNAQRKFYPTQSARQAWSEILEIYKKEDTNYKVLLPAYIGWSPNEGSGIFDSVKDSLLEFDFYNLDRTLNIDLNHLKQKVKEHTKVVVLLVHYFGFPDKKYLEVTEWLQQNNIEFVEDCAHAWMTDLIGGKCGRKGRFAFYSLHKMLPVNGGGVMVCNENEDVKNTSIQPFFQLNFDLYSIYLKRRLNYKKIVEKLEPLEIFEIFYEDLEDGYCPQTLPVIVKNYDRNLLYQKMNDADIGMVSLYHTMIEELKDSRSQANIFTSKHIINFPVHQDIDEIAIEEMISKLKSIIHV